MPYDPVMELVRFQGFEDPLGYTVAWPKFKFGHGGAPSNLFRRSEAPANRDVELG